jgi:hypothetical protein
MTIGKGKRPRDPNQLAKWIVDRSTSEAEAEEFIVPDKPAPPSDLSAYMAAIGRKGGQIGGKRLSAQDHDKGATSASGCKGR